MAQNAEKARHENPEPAAEEAEPKALDSAVDVEGILEDIDEVLEENAAEFVRSYVQKGGQ